MKLAVSMGLTLTLITSIGCGFHLRGKGDLPENIEQLVLDCQAVITQNLCKIIREQLELADISVMESVYDKDAEEISTILIIESLKEKRRAASLAADASAAEIELSRTAEFLVISPSTGGKPVALRATQFQSFQYSKRNVLGKAREEDQVVADIDRLLALEILNRFTSTISAPASDLSVHEN